MFMQHFAPLKCPNTWTAKDYCLTSVRFDCGTFVSYTTRIRGLSSTGTQHPETGWYDLSEIDERAVSYVGAGKW